MSPSCAESSPPELDVRANVEHVHPAGTRLEKLEIIRGIAALYVVLHHVWQHSALAGNAVAAALLSHGQLAVIVFFLLSGFVIEYSMHSPKQKTFGSYFRRRFRRIFPAFLFALLLSYIVAMFVIGNRSATGFRALFGNILMLQGFDAAPAGSWFPTFARNSPLWSLTYEWWFYMLYYPTRSRLRQNMQLYFVCMLSCAGLISNAIEPNQVSMILALFVIWWVGVEAARVYVARHCVPASTLTRSLAVMLLSGAVVAALFKAPFVHHSEHAVLGFQLASYESAVVTLAFALLLSRMRLPRFWKALRWAGLVAPFSYELYIFHFPLLIRAAPAYTLHAASLSVLLAATALTFALSIGFSHAAVWNWVRSKRYQVAT